MSDSIQRKEAVDPRLAALKQLARSGQGAAQDLERSPLVDLPAVIGEAGSNAPAEVRADTFLRILREVIATRLVGSDQAKAEALFGYGRYAGLPMQERYRAVAKIHDAKHGKWDNFRKEPLDDLLVTVLTGLHREGVARRAARPNGAGVDETELHTRRAIGRQPMIGGDFSLAHYEIFYNFPRQPGEPRETMELREVQATRDGLAHWQVGSRYWGKNADQAPSISLFGPGTLEVIRDQRLPQAATPGRAYVTRVTFPQPLMKGETVRFGLVRRQPVDFTELVRPGWRDQRDLTPIVPIDHAGIGIRFPAEHRPSAVWHFEDLPDYLGPGAPDETNRLAPDTSGYVTHNWNDLLVGHSYGLAWRW